MNLKRSYGPYLIIGSIFTDIVMLLFLFWAAWGVYYSHENPALNKLRLCSHECGKHGYLELEIRNGQYFVEGKRRSINAIKGILLYKYSTGNPRVAGLIRIDAYSKFQELRDAIGVFHAIGLYDIELRMGT